MLVTQKGLTLIELMIVIAILGLLGAIGLPMYQDYTVRAKVAEIILAASPAKTAVTEAVQTGGKLPAVLTLDTQKSQYVDSVSYARDAKEETTAFITVKAADQPRIGGKSLQFKAVLGADGLLTWTCGSASTDGIDAKYLPASCK